ncbi:MAG: beta-lactamase family protein [Caulobacteraceae bacterium]|nr:beta-lactamase family protein [Caulobacteraceae bacterium]
MSQIILEAVAKANGVPGMSAAVVRDGCVLWTGTTGSRDLERGLAVVPETAFRLASVSKLITATAAARLEDEGLLDVNAPIQDTVHYLSGAWPIMTARQLASHTAGLPHYQAIDTDRGRQSFASVRETVALFERRPLLSSPGERYSYSSWGYTLLSAVVEEAAGVPFLDYVATDVTAGLDIVPDTAPAAATDTLAYEIEGGSPKRAAPHDYSYSWGGAGFRAPAFALALFGDRVMSPAFLSDAAREAMWTPTRTNDGQAVTDDDSEVAFGWRITSSIDGERMAHHAGAAIGARSVLLVYPEQRVSVALLSNASWISSIERTAEMISAPIRDVPAGAGDAPCPVGARAFHGTFQDAHVTGTVRFQLEGGLCQGSVSADNAFGRWLNGFTQKPLAAFEVIALRADGRLDRAAFVSPIGAHEVRRGPEGGFQVDFGGGRSLEIVLQ